MCKGSKTALSPSNTNNMEEPSFKQKGSTLSTCSVLLELAASDDLVFFRNEVEGKGLDVNEASYWYIRRNGSRKMGFELRTPLMIAALFGSTSVVKYIIATGRVDVNRACGSDKVTALHCAVAGGSNSSAEIVKVLLDASADADCVDVNGNKPEDLFMSSSKCPCNSRRKLIESLLKGESLSEDEEEKLIMAVPTQLAKEGATERKEYPIDVSLPDINTGVYGTDEFRMYSFKVKPCSRAYSHDWTECPFVHPGENARRRDPRKYPYSCVPCPEFRKGSCQKVDSCEYAHGVFESWLHPAQYRTRLCKDETGCGRKVCFFAHKVEELRPVHAATGSAMLSPPRSSASGMEMPSLSPLSLGSMSMSLPTASTPPMSPLATASSSPKSGGLWQNKINFTPPALQHPGSRLKTAMNARDFDLELELLRFENQTNQLHQQQLMEEISGLSSPTCWRDLNPTNLDDSYHSPTGLQMRQNVNQLRSSYPSNVSSPQSVRKLGSYGGFDSSAAVAAAVMNSRSSAFTKRSQSFIDRGAAANNNRHGFTGPTANSVSMMSPPNNLSDWGSPDGRLDWGMQGDELNKLKRSASFGFRGSHNNSPTTRPASLAMSNNGEPDVSWVNSLVKDVPSSIDGGGFRENRFSNGSGVRESSIPPWMEQMYIEQEQMVA
ncbi:unnamed protein product [Linum tenue]|uniref:C3H1-type domain-containing protein n=3 Tax=Linum tenue TaxID=586396 RepID=A0AAV0MC09_9ROSI|nr:unnamed protein product [Linum tenue]